MQNNQEETKKTMKTKPAQGYKTSSVQRYKITYFVVDLCCFAFTCLCSDLLCHNHH